MSRTIDERIVSMQFNNKDFEKNVSVTMATLDKLKQKSNLDGAVKGFQNLGAAANKVDMSGLNNGVETLRARFSTLDVVGVTALANIANSAVNAGKRMVKALTIDPIMQGFNEYELKMNSVQTIMASTGADIATVNKYLEELNAYADKTIYSFSDMTSNIGKFTNAGVKLEDAVKAIQGISNEAALSGANANEASRAMYNFAQALSAGYVKLIDWKSIENANMATVEFKNELIKTGVELGTLVKKGDMYKSTTKDLKGDVSDAFNATKMFNESLSHQWMTTDVLTKTLAKYSDETTELGKKAFAAAQDVKTFSQLMDTLKEAVGSGWAQTFQIIFGDFEEAKKLWTGVNNVISPIIGAVSDFRNKMLGGALSSKWGDFTKKINDAGVSTSKFEKALISVAKKHDISLDKMIEKEGSLKNVIDKGLVSKDLLVETLKSFTGVNKEAGKSTEDLNAKLKKFQKIVDEVWRGNHKNVDTGRIESLKKAGYEYKEVQALVNKTVDGHRLTIEDLSEAQLKSVGYTEKEVDAIKKLADEAEKAGTPLNELIDQLGKPTGREMLFTGIHNVVQPLITVLKSLGEAWVDAFPPNGNFLYKLIEAFYNFSKHLIISKDAAEDLTRTFKGMFALLDLISMVVGGVFGTGFKIAAKVMSELWKALGLVNVSILEVTGNIGDTIVAVRDWIEEHSILNGLIEKGVPILVNMVKTLGAAATAIGNFVRAGWDLPIIQEAISSIGEAFKSAGDLIDKHFGKSIQSIKDFVRVLSDVENFTPEKMITSFKNMIKVISEDFAHLDFSTVGQNIVQGLANGIRSAITGILTIAQSMAEYLINGFKDMLGIHSPSTVFEGFGTNIIEGLINGIQNGISLVIEAIKKLGTMIADAFSGLDFADVFVIGTGITSFFLGRGLVKGFKSLTEVLGKPLEGVSGVLESFAGVLDSFSGIVDAKKLEMKSDAMLNMAKAIGILATAIVVMTLVDTGKLWGAIGALTVIASVMGSLAFAMSKVPDIKSFGKMSVVMISLSVSLAIMATAVKKIGELDFQSAVQGITALGVIMSLMTGMVVVFDKFSKGKIGKNIDKAGKMFFKMSVAIGMLALVVKLIGSISVGDLAKGSLVIGGAAGMFALLTLIAKGSGANFDKVGKMFFKMSVAIGALVLVIKLISTISIGDIIKGGVVIAGAAAMFIALTDIVKGSGKNADKVGKLFTKFSLAIGILATSIKLIATMSMGDIFKGGVVIAGAGAMLLLLSKITKGSGKNIDKAGSLFLKFSVAVGVLALAIKMVSGISAGELAKGGVVITGVGVLFSALIAVSKYAGEHAAKAGTMLMKMGVAIGIMAFSLRLIASLSTGELAKGFIVVSGMTALFTALIAVSYFAGEFADKAGSMLIKASGALMILVGAIAVLSLIDLSKVMVGTVAISTLMGMFMLLTKLTNGFKIGKIGQLYALSGVVAILAGIVGALSLMNPNSVLGSATALSELLLALSVSMKILGTIRAISPTALVAAGIMTLIVGALSGILYLIKDMPVESTLTNAKALSTLLLSLSAACLILAGVGLTGPAAYVGIGALITLIGSMGVLMGAIGALTTYFPDLELFLNKGIRILNSIANGIGSFVGNIIDGFLTAATDGLPDIGNTLSSFMTNLKPFLDGAKQIDESMMNGVKALASSILILTASDVLQGLTSWFTGGSSLEEFGKQLVPFGDYLSSFYVKTKGIKGENFNNIAQATKALVEMANLIPSQGGLKDKIVGVKDLTSFGSSLESFADSIIKYSQIVSNDTFNVQAIKSSADAAKAIVEVANSIPAEGGFWQLLSGDKDLSVFGKKLEPFATGLSDYSSVVSSDTFKVKAIKSSVEAVKAIVEIAKIMPSDGGLWGWLTGNNDIESFGKKLAKFGEGIAEYSTGVSTVEVDTITNSTSAAKSLVSLINSTSDINTSGVTKFVTAANQLAKVNIDEIYNAFNKDVSGLSSVGNKIIDAISKGMTSNKSTVTKNMATITSNILKEVTNKEAKFNTAGKTLVAKLSSGIDSDKSKVVKAVETMMKAAKRAADSYGDDFNSVGKSIAKGLANGISANTYLGAAKAKAMAEQAEKAARKALDINSPSKVFTKIGSYIPEGFAQGITMFGSAIKKSVGNMSDTAISNTESAMSYILSAINTDMDSQPTIRPVLDLSDIKAGAGQIGNMLGMTPSIGVMANVGAINTAMNRRNQNGSNSDVISAITKLGKDIKQSKGPSYNIGGVSYEKGTEVSDAVEALIRAIKVEGRV